MDVILCQEVTHLGRTGDIVRVKPGYARNFLLPKKLACQATPANRKKVEQQKVKEAAAAAEKKKAAEELAEKLNKVSCTVTVEVNDLDKLYGSVTDVDIIKALEVEGYQIDKKDIILDKPIEDLGIFDVKIQIHPEVVANIRLWVAKK